MSRGSPVPAVFVFLYGGHAGTVTRLISLLKHIDDFYRGDKWSESGMPKFLARRNYSKHSDPLDVFLAIVEGCFRDEF